ncbi:Bifunctional purine biosynthesis protein PurH [Streptomyces glaucescens]
MTAESNKRPLRRALVSVYDKTGLEDLARGLHEAGVALVSTGSTAARIADAGVPVTKVEELTGFPECLDGRVKTLHPRVHAGILADLRLEDHQRQLAELGVEPFDLVVVNLYPFRETVASGASPDECVEQIDIGGPSMVRAAAKNHPSVAVVTSPARYADVLDAPKDGGFDLATRKRLAAEAFQHTAAYDVAVAAWFAASTPRSTTRRSPTSWAPPGSARARCATARTRTSPPRCTSPVPAAAWPRPSSCTARRCRTTTTRTRTPPAVPRTTTTSRAWRSSSTPTRAAPRSARTSPRQHRKAHALCRCPRSGCDRGQGTGVAGEAEPVAEIFPGRRRAGCEEGCPLPLCSLKKHTRSSAQRWYPQTTSPAGPVGAAEALGRASYTGVPSGRVADRAPRRTRPRGPTWRAAPPRGTPPGRGGRAGIRARAPWPGACDAPPRRPRAPGAGAARRPSGRCARGPGAARTICAHSSGRSSGSRSSSVPRA